MQDKNNLKEKNHLKDKKYDLLFYVSVSSQDAILKRDFAVSCHAGLAYCLIRKFRIFINLKILTLK
ncbi:hypothetical protein XSR1_320037 [Xenorhabdus szentirmaii DSM 16338]|uniref:Uncharacterized protein n=1 Tax=Xenorhabdus szentirmaii DSM 16338 TaxID=1427518 RepID=W1J292_9GAMM|nr:hypothetical protein XSR1_320037 [Xenorhabdus szentirmaii DSM 16338]